MLLEPAASGDEKLQLAIAQRRDPDGFVRSTIAARSDVTDDALRAIAAERGGLYVAAQSRRASAELLAELPPELAGESTGEVRRFVARHPRTAPETLARIVDGPRTDGVHELLAKNPATPADALRRL